MKEIGVSTAESCVSRPALQPCCEPIQTVRPYSAIHSIRYFEERFFFNRYQVWRYKFDPRSEYCQPSPYQHLPVDLRQAMLTVVECCPFIKKLKIKKECPKMTLALHRISLLCFGPQANTTMGAQTLTSSCAAAKKGNLRCRHHEIIIYILKHKCCIIGFLFTLFAVMWMGVFNIISSSGGYCALFEYVQSVICRQYYLNFSRKHRPRK